MHLRLSILALKIKIAKILDLGFAIFMIFVAQSITDTASLELIGIKLGFIVWIIAIVKLIKDLHFNFNLAEIMSDADDEFFDLNEFATMISLSDNTVDKLKLRRFTDALADVFTKSGLNNNEKPEIFVSRAKNTTNLEEDAIAELSFEIYHTGLGSGKVITVSSEGILDEDLTQRRMSYILAHELGHSFAHAMFHINIAFTLAKAAKSILRFFYIPTLIIGITQGSWLPLFTLIGMNLVNSFLGNLVMRLEEYFADSYATSLGFGDGADELFKHFEDKGIGTFPPFLEIFVNHPTNNKRRSQVLVIQNNDQGIIPDFFEKWLYALVAIGIGIFIYKTTNNQYALLATFAYLGAIGSLITLCNSELLPKTAFYFVVRAVNLILTATTIYFLNIAFVIPNMLSIAALASAIFIYTESILNRFNPFFNTLGHYFETLLFFGQLLVLFQALMLVNLFVPHLF